MHYKNKTKYLLTLPLLYVISFAGMCNSDSKVRTLAKSEDDLAQGLKSTATLIKEAEDTNLLTKEDVREIKAILTSVSDANGQAITLAKSFSSLTDIPADKKQQLLNLVSFASKELVRLNAEGALRIKDPDKKAVFSALVLAMQSAVTSVVVTLNLKGK